MATEQVLQQIQSALSNGGTALRANLKLTPAGGDGDKVFPPTYEGGQYATEQRLINGERVETVLLDSVQSQANRIEQALLSAHRQGRIQIPVLEVDFGVYGRVTSLDAPHRIFDSIFWDCQEGETAFRTTGIGSAIGQASPANATALLTYAPNVLAFGGWDSQMKRHASGTKIARALASEIIGVGITPGVRPASRIDPLGISSKGVTVYKAADPEKVWTLNEGDAEVDSKGNPQSFGKKGNPSEIVHSNITPSLKNERGEEHHGGVTLREARQTVVLSLPQLRRLSFPDDSGATTSPRDVAGRTLVAAYALCGMALQAELGYDLRSRCLLVPEADPEFEVLGRTKSDVSCFSLSPDEACELLRLAVDKATSAGLPWHTAETIYTARPDLIEMVRRSRKIQTVESEEG